MPKGIVTNPTGKGGFQKGQSGNPSGKAKPRPDNFATVLERTAKAVEAIDQDVPDVERRHNGQFAKGVSGNPGGKHKDTAKVAAAAREWTAEAIATLAHVMQHGESEQARVSASNALLDRGYGKPEQSVDQTVRTPDVARPSDHRPDLQGIRHRIMAESRSTGAMPLDEPSATAPLHSGTA